MASSTLLMTPSAPSISSHPSSCPSCGSIVPTSSTTSDATRRISDLEAQVKLLNTKAAAAVDRIADYEDEVRYLRTQLQRPLPNSSTPITTPDEDSSRPKTSSGTPIPAGRLSSLSSFLSRKRPSDGANNLNLNLTPTTPAHSTLSPSVTTGLGIGASPQYNSSTPNLPSGHAPPLPTLLTSPRNTSFSSPPNPFNTPQSNPTLLSLQSSLENEHSLRLQAESSLQSAHTELEELTAQLFGQANEMVAQERRERAKLEERVKTLEEREKGKGERLRRLEERVKRVERVRGMVG